MAVVPFKKSDPWVIEPARSGATLSSRIVDDVTAALHDKRLAPGDFLGTEKDMAERAGVSRIVARDALRTLQALGVVEIKVGAGGGARIARGNPALFAEALAVQLTLAGISVREMMDAQRAIETTAAELAAENATADDLARLRASLAEHEATIGDDAAYTRTCMRFHLAVAEASQNRVLVAQLLSLQHVSWPAQNRTLTAPVARHIIEVHRQLVDVIEARDAAAARRLMDDHVKMIRTRRVSEGDAPSCC
jgi:GntR family transcriptional repressor for pyruvate dehydrogenase complex